MSGECQAKGLPQRSLSPWDMTSTNSGSGGLVEHSPSPGCWLTIYPSPLLTILHHSPTSNIYTTTSFIALFLEWPTVTTRSPNCVLMVGTQPTFVSCWVIHNWLTYPHLHRCPWQHYCRLLHHPAKTLYHCTSPADYLHLLHTVYKCLGRDLVKILFSPSRKISCDFLFKVSKTTFLHPAYTGLR